MNDNAPDSLVARIAGTIGAFLLVMIPTGLIFVVLMVFVTKLALAWERRPVSWEDIQRWLAAPLW